MAVGLLDWLAGGLLAVGAYAGAVLLLVGQHLKGWSPPHAAAAAVAVAAGMALTAVTPADPLPAALGIAALLGTCRHTRGQRLGTVVAGAWRGA